MGKGHLGRADHFPPLGQPSRNARRGRLGQSACDVASEASPQNRLTGLLDFRCVLFDAEGLAEVASGADEERADARHCGNGIGVFYALGRFDHHDGQEIAVRIERPHIRAPLVLRR